ncbi:ATP-binding protein [Streptomyces sp. GC420]|nr:ATP-binding protein [Streptomyces sp. GC420]
MGSVVQCPPAPPDGTEPSPENLACALALPSTFTAPTLAADIARLVLTVHRLGTLTEPALLLVGELVANAVQFTPAGEYVHLALGYRDNSLRLVVHDTHARHRHPRLASACDARRLSQLSLVPEVVREHDGDWGFGDAHEPAGGTRTWAVLPVTERAGDR